MHEENMETPHRKEGPNGDLNLDLFADFYLFSSSSTSITMGTDSTSTEG